MPCKLYPILKFEMHIKWKPLKDKKIVLLSASDGKKKKTEIFADGFIHLYLWSIYEWFYTIIFWSLMKGFIIHTRYKAVSQLANNVPKKKKKNDFRSNLDRWSNWSVNQTVFNMLYTTYRIRKTHIALQIKLHTPDRERPALQISAHGRQTHAYLQCSYQCNCS